MNVTSKQLAQILGCTLPTACNNRHLTQVLTDSRSLSTTDGVVFFALITPQNDGHKFVTQLMAQGVKDFVVTHIPELEIPSDVNFHIVADTLTALQKLATYWRNKFAIPTVAIIGSRGKTTVKEWLNRLMPGDCTVTRSPRSYNSQIGVPLSLLMLDDHSQTGLFEAGISMPGEMQKLHAMLHPQICLITNITGEHSAGFKSIREKCREKLIMAQGCATVVYNADDPIVAGLIEQSTPAHTRLGWSLHASPNAVLHIHIDSQDTATLISYTGLGLSGSFTIPFVAKHDIENAISALATMLALGFSDQHISQRMPTLTPVRTRMEVIDGVADMMIIDDGYDSDPISLPQALDLMRRQNAGNREMAIILSDLMHHGTDLQQLYAQTAHTIEAYGITQVHAIGHEIKAMMPHLHVKAIHHKSVDDFLRSNPIDTLRGKCVLLKGGHHFKFKQIARHLEARQHETVLDINLDAVVHNFNTFKSQLHHSTGMVCMVKASGYGAGSFQLAKTLQAQGASYLAVAVHDEGVDLRKCGITMPIMVMNPMVDNYTDLFNHHLEPEINNFTFLTHLISEAQRLGITDYPIHIKIDSGMHRLGFLKHEIPELIHILKSQSAVRAVSVFSHLAAADDPSSDQFTLAQIDYFSQCADMLRQAFPWEIKRHILNTSGITRFSQYQFEMVRLGIGLYGIKTLSDGSQDNLLAVSRLTSPIISIRKWPEGTTIGYNRRGLLRNDSVIATIPIGYADGLNRHLGNGNLKVWVNGKRCPTVGSICMDACMIDVTAIAHDIKMGDRVEIFGPHVPVYELAETLQTIPYEILTSISTRVKRVYYHE